MTDILSWSATDASNTGAAPAGAPEGMAPSGVNDTIRAIQGAIRRFFDHITPQVATAGTANAQTLTYSVAPSALASDDVFFFQIGGGLTNTGAVTLNINGLGAKAVQWNGDALVGGELQAAQCYGVRYDGVQFQLIWHPLPSRIIPQTTFAPTDQSGAGLTLTTDCKFSQDMECVSFYGRITYPPTVDTSHAIISLPRSTTAGTHQHATCVLVSSANTIFFGWVTSSNELVILNAGSNATNANLSGLTLDFFLRYPVT